VCVCVFVFEHSSLSHFHPPPPPSLSLGRGGGADRVLRGVAEEDGVADHNHGEVEGGGGAEDTEDLALDLLQVVGVEGQHAPEAVDIDAARLVDTEHVSAQIRAFVEGDEEGEGGAAPAEQPPPLDDRRRLIPALLPEPLGLEAGEEAGDDFVEAPCARQQAPAEEGEVQLRAGVEVVGDREVQLDVRRRLRIIIIIMIPSVCRYAASGHGCFDYTCELYRMSSHRVVSLSAGFSLSHPSRNDCKSVRRPKPFHGYEMIRSGILSEYSSGNVSMG
jgi:hypothetical protein